MHAHLRSSSLIFRFRSLRSPVSAIRYSCGGSCSRKHRAQIVEAPLCPSLRRGVGSSSVIMLELASDCCARPDSSISPFATADSLFSRRWRRSPPNEGPIRSPYKSWSVKVSVSDNAREAFSSRSSCVHGNTSPSTVTFSHRSIRVSPSPRGMLSERSWSLLPVREKLVR